MIFKGYTGTFSTIDNDQYRTIGDFWDFMTEKFGLENIVGLGYLWLKDEIYYAIGLKGKDIDKNLQFENFKYCEIALPDDDWKIYRGRTEDLTKFYDEIYKNGRVKYELENFFEDGSFEIWIIQ